nr:putative ribonuclease H-like domain-containing protein [Tanacetum cinerariifolium]
MEEYIDLEAEKARRRGQTFNWEAATYGNVRYSENIDYFRDFETDFPAIIYDNALTTDHEVSSEPTIRPLNNNEVDFRISFDESDDKDYICIYDKSSFSSKLIFVNDLKTILENGIDEVSIPPNDVVIEKMDNGIDTRSYKFDEYFETNHDIYREPSNMEEYLIITEVVIQKPFHEGMPLVFIIKNLYVQFGIPFDPSRFYKDGVCIRKLRRPRDILQDSVGLPRIPEGMMLLSHGEGLSQFQPSDGYYAVPLPYTGIFMPPKPDLVFNTAPTAVETDHPAFTVQLNPTKPAQDLSHINRPTTPIIDDWVSDSKDESETKAPQIVSILTQSKPVSITVVRLVSAVVPKSRVTQPRHAKPFVTKSKSPIRRHLTRSQSPKTSTLPPRVTAIKAPVVSAAQGMKGKLKWRPKCPILDHVSRTINASMTLKRFDYNDALGRSKLVMAWGTCPINLILRSSMVDMFPLEVTQNVVIFLEKEKSRQNNVLFTETECLVLYPDFKLPDESQVLLRVSRENNMYNVNLKNIVPSGDLTCLFAKATIDESNLWHRRLGHINFKKINKLVKCNLVKGLPSKVLENDNTCVACKKGKKHKAFCKTKPDSSVDQPLYRIHIDLFRPTFVKSLNKKSYYLVITDNYSRFTWVFFLATKDETSPILKTFITGLENQLSIKVKVIKSDNGTEFKNNDLNQFCEIKGIKKEFSVPRTPQQNGIAERKNMTLFEAARTMLADLLLPISFWAEVVNTACYVQNRVLVTKPHNKTPYELLHGRIPSNGFMRPFGCPVTILNTLDSLGEFKGKVNEGFLIRYSVNSKAFRVFNSRTRIVQETLHVNFLENKPNIAGSGPTWLFDIDSLTKTMNYQPVTAGNQTNTSAGFQDKFTAEKAGEEIDQQYEPDFDAKKLESEVNVSPSSSAQSRKQDDKTKKEAKGKSPHNTFSVAGPSNVAACLTYGKSLFIDACQLPDDPDMPELEEITYSDDEDDVGA